MGGQGRRGCVLHPKKNKKKRDRRPGATFEALTRELRPSETSQLAVPRSQDDPPIGAASRCTHARRHLSESTPTLPKRSPNNSAGPADASTRQTPTGPGNPTEIQLTTGARPKTGSPKTLGTAIPTGDEVVQPSEKKKEKVQPRALGTRSHLDGRHRGDRRDNRRHASPNRRCNRTPRPNRGRNARKHCLLLGFA